MEMLCGSFSYFPLLLLHCANALLPLAPVKIEAHFLEAKELSHMASVKSSLHLEICSKFPNVGTTTFSSISAFYFDGRLMRNPRPPYWPLYCLLKQLLFQMDIFHSSWIAPF